MKAQNKSKIAYLFREIGEVDDALVQEALAYRPKRTAFERILMVAACLTLSLMLCFGVLLISLRSKDAPNDQGKPPLEDGHVAYSLDQLLLAQADSGSYTVLQSVEKAEFFGGRGYIVWQYADSNELFVSRALSDAELLRLTDTVGKGASVGEQSPALSCRVWLILGNGEVISPYLKESCGNRGYAELFDYDVEVLPTDEFIACVSDILS